MPKLADVVGRQRADLLERALVQQQRQAFAGRQLALGVLGVDALLAARLDRAGAHRAQFAELGVVLVHRDRITFSTGDV